MVARDSSKPINKRISGHPHHFFVGGTLASCFDQSLNSRVGTQILLGEEQLDVGEVGRDGAIGRTPGFTNKKTSVELLIKLSLIHI